MTDFKMDDSRPINNNSGATKPDADNVISIDRKMGDSGPKQLNNNKEHEPVNRRNMEHTTRIFKDG